jgi:hypothetical protein
MATAATLTTVTAMNTYNPRQLARFLARMIAARKPVLISGAPGVGKTDIVRQAAQAALARFIVWHPVLSDPTDFKGLPGLDAKTKTASFYIFDKLKELVNATELTVVLLDDLAHAPTATQSAAMHLLHAREIDGVKIPDCVVFIAATNRVQDMAGVSAIIEPMKSRFVSIVELVADVASWRAWAIPYGIPAKVIAYIDAKGINSLSKFTPTKQLTNSPSPRTWSHVAELEEIFGDADDLKWPAIHGAIGDAEATSYHTFSELFDVLPEVQYILDNPHTAPIPTQIDTRYATALALANRTNRQNLKAVCIYSQRLADHSLGEYAVLILRDASKRDAALLHTTEWTRTIATGPLGQLFSGAA